ncbi:S9 family peptidase [Microbacterium saperdae]
MPSPALAYHPAADVIAGLEFVHSADLSPDGTRVAWTHSRIEGDIESIELRLTVVGEQGHTVLVTGGRNTHPEFSPDGRTIAFLRSHAQRPPQVATIGLQGGEIQELTTIPQGVSSRPRWSPDGARIAFSVGPESVDRSLPFRMTRAVGWLDGLGLVDDAVTDIHVLDLADSQVTRLTHEDGIVGSPEWHADSARLSFTSSAAHDDWHHEGRIRTVDLAGEIRTDAALSDIFGLAVHRNGLVGTSRGSAVKGDVINGQLFTLDAEGGVTVRSGDLDVHGDVIPDLPIPFTDPSPVILLHGDHALVRTQNGDRHELHRVTLVGDPHSVLELAGEGSIYGLALRGDVLLYAVGDRLTAPDLRVRNLITGHDVAVTDTAAHNRNLLTPLRVEQLWAHAEGGPAVQTTFLAPADSVGPLPTVLLIHGGPESGFGEALFLDAQLLCEAGLGVLLVNPRGSRGYGNEHIAAIRGDWGGIDADDFHAAVDLAIERGLADPERLGVAGLSYGGYMTTWLIGHSDRFAAAVAENPVTNLVSFYGTSDIGLTFGPRQLGGPIDTAFDQYLKSSPVMAAEAVTTPTLLIISDQDHRCPPEQALQFYQRLRSTGCEAELLILPGASHAGSVNEAPVVRRAQNDAMADWLSTRLRGAGH